MKEMQDNAERAAGFLKGLANQHRLLILCQLVDGEKNVTTMIEATGIAQTSMSQHLNKLKDENIVTARREHRELFYTICDDTVLNVMDILHQKFCKE